VRLQRMTVIARGTSEAPTRGQVNSNIAIKSLLLVI
jgi:hypothetical protein